MESFDLSTLDGTIEAAKAAARRYAPRFNTANRAPYACMGSWPTLLAGVSLLDSGGHPLPWQSMPRSSAILPIFLLLTLSSTQLLEPAKQPFGRRIAILMGLKAWSIGKPEWLASNGMQSDNPSVPALAPGLQVQPAQEHALRPGRTVPGIQGSVATFSPSRSTIRPC